MASKVSGEQKEMEPLLEIHESIPTSVSSSSIDAHGNRWKKQHHICSRTWVDNAKRTIQS